MTKLLEIFEKAGVPDHYRFVFDRANKLGLYAVLAMTEDGRSAAWVHEYYDPETTNDHLGERITLQELAINRPKAFDAFIGWAAVNSEYGRDEAGNVIKEERTMSTEKLPPEEAINDFDTLANDLLDEVRINVAAGYLTSAIPFYIGQMRRLYEVASQHAGVTVEVLGGVAQVTENPANIPVEIIDHDNEEA